MTILVINRATCFVILWT